MKKLLIALTLCITIIFSSLPVVASSPTINNDSSVQITSENNNYDIIPYSEYCNNPDYTKQRGYDNVKTRADEILEETRLDFYRDYDGAVACVRAYKSMFGI